MTEFLRVNMKYDVFQCESDYPADALMAVVQKLSGPFHFELAADSIAVKVSEGIMHMQENSITISAKVKHTFTFKTHKYLHVSFHFTESTSEIWSTISAKTKNKNCRNICSSIV